MLPAKAGINKFIHQIPNVVPKMPTMFALYRLNKAVLNFPRIPKSAIANDGTMASTKKSMLIIQKLLNQNISTCNTCRSNIYCRTKTRYRKKERERSLNNNLAVNRSKTLKYCINFTQKGIFSNNLISHESLKKNKIRKQEIRQEINNRNLIQYKDNPITYSECRFSK